MSLEFTIFALTVHATLHHKNSAPGRVFCFLVINSLHL